MPLPLILGMGAAAAAAVGATSGVQGAVKMKKASDTQKKAQRRHQRNLKRFEQETETTNQEMDDLGKLELSILKDFETFSDLMEKIQNRPEFKNLAHEEVQIPEYNPEELKKTSVFAAAGATTAAVMALGTASTGTAIASLSGAAAVNATLAALGGGALAAGGGGMALGSAVLGAATLGVGILVGGIIFNLVGNSISDKADEAWKQMKEAEDEINRICQYLNDLYVSAGRYKDSLLLVQEQYEQHLQKMKSIILEEGRTDWNAYTPTDKTVIENTVLLVGLLYKMCKVQVVLQPQDGEGINQVNHSDLNQNIADAKSILQKVA